MLDLHGHISLYSRIVNGFFSTHFGILFLQLKCTGFSHELVIHKDISVLNDKILIANHLLCSPPLNCIVAGASLPESQLSDLLIPAAPVLWELLQPIDFKILAHCGHGLMYFNCMKAYVTLFSAGFGSSSQCTQRTVDHYPYCEFIPK